MLSVRSENPPPSLPADREEHPRGQYMVEFALSFAIFVIFVLIVIDLGLLIYNHNLFYHGVSKGARVASLGGTNEDVKDAVSREVLPSYFPTMLLVAEPEPVSIEPEEEMLRVDGKEVTVRMDARFGMSVLWFGNVTIGFPIRSSSVIIQNNDQDRDGCKDSLEGVPGNAGPECDSWPNVPWSVTFRDTIRRDHLNDRDGSNSDSDVYLFGALPPSGDIDADSPGRSPHPLNQDDGRSEDTVAVGYFRGGAFAILGADTFLIHRPDPQWSRCNTVALSVTGTLSGASWETCFHGEYHAPPLWSSGVEHPPSLFPQSFPTRHVDFISDGDHPGYDTRVLHTPYDFDNDGWEDKYDEFPANPTRH